jgi:hypothetical protein
MKIEIIMFEVGKDPRLMEVGRELRDFQELIGGGYVEAVTLADGTCLWCDERGKLKELPPNRIVPELGDVVCGPFFLTGGADDEGETLSVPRAVVAALGIKACEQCGDAVARVELDGHLVCRWCERVMKSSAVEDVTEQ